MGHLAAASAYLELAMVCAYHIGRMVSAILQVLAEWCKQTDALLAESGAGIATSLNDEAGPDTELEFWRVRMAKFNSVTEQIKSKECRLVMGVCSTARSKQYKRWKEVDVKVTVLNMASQIC